MSEPVTSEIDGGIGIVRVDNPPVNALSNAVRAGIAMSIDMLERDERVGAIVILCAGRTFIAGADITEFGKPRQPPSLAEICDRIEASAKPVVAALHGTALGGGFEVALACHHRIALARASVGLPEVKLGLIPGAGGANRLARIVGPLEALNLVASGASISAPEALALGLVDRIAQDGLEAEARALAREVVGQAPVSTRGRHPPRGDSEAFEAAAEGLLRKTRGQDAPAACVESLRRALDLPFDEAIAADRAAFAGLSAGSQSRALRHAFFAERVAAKIDGPPAAPLPKSIAILGAGTMGGGIAMSFAAAGIPVTLIDMSAEAVERGLARIATHQAGSVKRGSLAEDEAARRLALIATATERGAAADADLVIEAVFEDMALKREIFADLDRLCRPDAILATNTSALDVNEMARALRRPERFLGLHFFSPAVVMKLVEVVTSDTTSPATLATAVAIARRIGKVPVVSGNCDGFIGNRMVAKRGAQVDRLLQQGALPQDVDGALKAFGFPMGPLAINDMSGLDIGYSIRKRRGTKFPVADAVVESGRLGQKTGRGYYRYEEGSRTPLPDPEVEALIASISDRLGIARRAFSQEEMVERMLFPLINEGARLLEEGIARRASDVDVVWINGYGFPRWRGGPMFHAGEVELKRVAARLVAFAEESGDASLRPAPLLTELAATGRSFTDWDRDRRPATS
ncbi:MAG: 3-hydroxyacyl-CoA dehydrogenase NAD-binding domain-containing protein [Flavobacteriaceae bacterium]